MAGMVGEDGAAVAPDGGCGVFGCRVRPMAANSPSRGPPSSAAGTISDRCGHCARAAPVAPQP